MITQIWWNILCISSRERANKRAPKAKERVSLKRQTLPLEKIIIIKEHIKYQSYVAWNKKVDFIPDSVIFKI